LELDLSDHRALRVVDRVHQDHKELKALEEIWDCMGLKVIWDLKAIKDLVEI